MINAPRADRPTMDRSYAVPSGRRGLLAWHWARRRLVAAHNYWMSTTGPGGRPHAMPVWGLWLDEAFVFSTARRSRKARNLARDSRLVVHLESGDQTVILEGRATVATDPSLLERYVAAYERKYRYRPDPADRKQVTYTVRPLKALAWRERDFPQSATRWHFPLPAPRAADKVPGSGAVALGSAARTEQRSCSVESSRRC